MYNASMSLELKINTNYPIVFIHGSFANSRSWRKIIESLQPAHRCYTLDLPGHGNTPTSDNHSSPTMKSEFDVLSELINGIEDHENGIHLVGHSYGAVVALSATMTGQFPIKKLTLFESVDASILETFEKTYAYDAVMAFENDYRNDCRALGNAACANIFDFWGGPGSYDNFPEHFKSTAEELTIENLRHWTLIKNNGKSKTAFRRLKIPTSIIIGSKSNLVAKEISKSLHENLPKSVFHEINGASHFMINTHPKECAEFLKM